MKEAIALHREAMVLADRALIAKTEDDQVLALGLTKQAFAKEAEAAGIIANDTSLEPTRAVLHRSAASLALECGETREAERLIATGLAGNPPEEIAEELRDLLEDVYFRRHLDVRGVTLQDDEFQLSLEGRAVGFGIAPSALFVDRVQTIETMLYRTAERRLGRPFREGGRRKKSISEEIELYVSVPRAASFAVTFKVGKSEQMRFPFPEVNFGREVINDFLECIDLINEGETEKLREKIPDESYYHNFMGLALQIAPDGEEIRTVGFTSVESGKKRYVAISKTTNESRKKTLSPGTKLDEGGSLLELKGRLLGADARKQKNGKIEIVDDNGKTYHVVVPRGMMSDIVRPMFEEQVVVHGSMSGKHIILQTITLLE